MLPIEGPFLNEYDRDWNMEWDKEEDNRRTEFPQNRRAKRWREHVDNAIIIVEIRMLSSQTVQVVTVRRLGWNCGPEETVDGPLEGFASDCERTGRCPQASPDGPDLQSNSLPTQVDVALTPMRLKTTTKTRR
eukprot:5184504-Amphidinium_carterae.2